MSKRLNDESRAFVEFFERECGVKFIDCEDGSPILDDKTNE